MVGPLLLLLAAVSHALECFDCTNYPDGITCSTTASCLTSHGCYYATSKDLMPSSEIPFWVSSCATDLRVQNHQTSCFQTDRETLCICFNDFCNSPVEITNAIELRYSPFLENPKLPWTAPTTQVPTRTTSGTPFPGQSIPTTLVTVPPRTASTTTSSAVRVAGKLTVMKGIENNLAVEDHDPRQLLINLAPNATTLSPIDLAYRPNAKQLRDDTDAPANATTMGAREEPDDDEDLDEEYEEEELQESGANALQSLRTMIVIGLFFGLYGYL